MKRLTFLVVLVCLMVVSCGFTEEIKVLGFGIGIPLPSETKISLLSNLQVSPYQDITLNRQAFAFSTKLVQQWDVFYLGGGYSTMDSWLFLAGVDILEGARRIGAVINSPIKDGLEKIGIKKITLDFFISYFPDNKYGKVITFCAGSQIFEISK